jgi:hypothetical protein
MIQRDRVREHSPEKFNQRIDRATQRRVLRAGGKSKAALSRHLEQLDEEWDMERVLQINASALALGGLLLGLFANRKFLILPCVVLPFFCSTPPGTGARRCLFFAVAGYERERKSMRKNSP